MLNVLCRLLWTILLLSTNHLALPDWDVGGCDNIGCWSISVSPFSEGDGELETWDDVLEILQMSDWLKIYSTISWGDCDSRNGSVAGSSVNALYTGLSLKLPDKIFNIDKIFHSNLIKTLKK